MVSLELVGFLILKSFRKISNRPAWMFIRFNPSAWGINERVRSKVMSSATSDLLEATWEETDKELKEEWMEIDHEGGKNSS
jgi:hypothetical protein